MRLALLLFSVGPAVLSAVAAAAPTDKDAPPPLAPRVAAALETIEADDARTYVAYLASDSLAGRNAGTEGNDLAVRWIAQFFVDQGLQGGGPDGSFLQPFHFDAGARNGGEIETANVIAVWEGADPLLKGQAVVVGAHLDHVGALGQASNPARLGKPRDGDAIWNGADDNASGTAAVMEIAQAFALARVPARRTVIFICFNAEEHGLFGSQAYVETPFIPIEQTSAMINLDMVGRNPGQPVMVFGLESEAGGTMRNFLEAAAPRFPEIELQSKGGAFGGSDHWAFMTRGVPCAFFFTGFHPDYHKISDETDKIDFGRLAGVARAAFLLAVDIANRDDQLEIDPDYSQQILAKRGRLLGIDVDRAALPAETFATLDLAGDRGAIKVAGVYRGTAADRAGLKPGDLILSLGTVHIRRQDPYASLREAIRAAPEETGVPIAVVRTGELLTLTARWEAKGE